MPTFSNYVSRSLTVGVSAFALFMTLSLTAAGEETAGWMYRQYPPTPAGGYTGGEFKRLYDNFMLPQVCPNGQVFFGFLGGPDAVNGSERGKPRCVSNFSLSGGIILESPTANVGKLYLGGAYDFSYDGGTDGNYVFSNLADANGKTTFRGNSLDILTVHNNGNVGIGTTAPSDKLTVVGAGNFGGQVSVDTLASRGEITAENGYDQRLYIGGDAAGNDFEIGSVTAAQSNLSFFNRATGTYMNIGAQNGTFLWMLNAQGGFITERRSGSDPASPVDGQMWLRTDVAPVSGSVTAGGGGGAGLSGGSTNYLARWNGSSSVGVSSIFDNGKIGIGTNQPGTLNGFNASYMAADHLDVEITGKARDTAFSDGTILLTSNRPTPTAGDRVGAIFFASKNNGNASSANNFGSAIAGQLVGAGGSNGFGSTLGFWTAPNSGASAQRMLIDSDGNVGIGAATIANRYVSGVNAARVLDIVGGSQHAGISILAGAGKNAFIDFRDPLNPNSVRANLFYDDTNSGTLFINPGLATNVSINPDAGNVGIGTTAPDSKLTVAGNVNATGLCINGDCRTSWPTYGATESCVMWRDVAPAQHTTCALRSDGTVWCWGNADDWRAGYGGNQNLNFAGMQQVVGLGSVKKIQSWAGELGSCALKEDGTLWCWGRNYYQRIATKHDDSRMYRPYRAMDDFFNTRGRITDFYAGYNDSCVVLEDGTLWCWGRNDQGQLGIGNTTRQSAPVQVTSLGNSVKSVAMGLHTTCALLTDGTVKCFGYDWQGQLGDNSATTSNKSTPVFVSFPTTTSPVVEIAGYSDDNQHGQFCARKQDGTVWCWGQSYYGSLWDGTDADKGRPVQVVGITNATSISVGQWACAGLANGGMKCWGDGNEGETGNNTKSPRINSTPVNVLISEVRSIGLGTDTRCAIRTDGRLLCWGYNNWYNAGNGTNDTADITEPEIVDGGLNYCVPEGAPAPACMDGIDNDGDGRMDDEDGGCWTTTVVGGKTEIDRSQQSNYNPLDQDESNGDIYPTRTLRDTGASPGTTLWNIAADGSINPDSITSGRYLNFARGGGNGYNGWCGSQRVNAQWDIKTGYLNYWNFAQNHSGCGNAVEYNYPVQMGGMYKQGGTQY